MSALARTPPRGVPRPRLLARLGGRWTVAVLSAPAGYGKSTLAAQFAARRPAMWLRIAPEHADPARLLDAMLEAARHGRPPFGRRTVMLHASRRDWERDGARLTGSLLDELVSAPRLVVLDDLHLVAAGAALDWLRQVIESARGRVRFLITCRGECPLPLSRIDAEAGVLRLGAAELAFTSAEQVHALRDGFRVRLSAAEQRTLHARTGGWPAAIALAGRAVRQRRGRRPGAAPPVDPVRGAEKFLEEEVLRPLPGALLSDLERLALVDAIDGATARRVLGRNAARTLREIRARDLFIQEGGPGVPDRFHPLLRRALLEGLRRRHPPARRRGVARRLLAVAGAEPARAVRLLIDAGLPAAALARFERAARAATGEEGALPSLAARLGEVCGPEAALSPWVRLHRAHHTVRSDETRALADARAAREAFAARRDWNPCAAAFRLEARLALRDGSGKAAIRRGAKLWGRVPRARRRARAEIARTLSEAAQHTGDPRAGSRWLACAGAALGSRPRPLDRADLEVRRATLLYTEGRWEDYVAGVSRVLAQFERAGYARRAQALHFNLAEASIHLGDELGALAHLDAAAALEPRGGMPGARVLEAELRGRAHSERGELARAADLFRALRSQVGAGSFAALRLDVWEGILLRRRRRLASARRLLERAIRGFQRIDAPSWTGLARLERALVRGLEGHPREALRELAIATRVSRAMGDDRERARAALYQAAIHEAAGRSADGVLRRALRALERLDYLVLLRKEADIARPLLEPRRPRAARAAGSFRRPPIRIGLLGGFRLAAVGRPVPLTRTASRMLLARLALAPDHAARLESLAESLWPGAAPATSRNRMDVTLHAARRALEPAAGRRGPFRVLVVEGGWCRLVNDAIAVDAAEFERLARECEPLLRRLDADPWNTALPRPERRAALERLGRALERCAGPLLPEWPDAFTDERERLRSREVRLRLAAGRLHLAGGDAAAAQQQAALLLAGDPLDESAGRLDAVATVALGGRAEARRRLRAFVRRYRRALDAPPGPELMATLAALEGGTPLP